MFVNYFEEAAILMISTIKKIQKKLTTHTLAPVYTGGLRILNNPRVF